MKFLLINPPIRLNANPNCIPTGLAQIASVLRDFEHDVEILDINALRLKKATVRHIIQNSDFDWYFISGLITTYGYQQWLIELCRPRGLVCVGGGGVTSVPDLYRSADARCKGEGETWVVENICRSKKRYKSIDDLPLPAWDLLPMDIYLKNPIWGEVAGNSSRLPIKTERSMNIVTSRGCPFSCNYCFHLFGRSSYTQRSVTSVIQEIDVLVDSYQVDFIGFVDDNMMTNKEWMNEFCEKLYNRYPNLYWGCHGRVGSASDSRILYNMFRAGCRWIGFGVESSSPKILKNMGKRQTVELAKRAIRNCREVGGIYPNTTFIFGYPGETADTVQETIDFKKEMEIECGSFYATAYPGTPLYEQVKDKILDKFGVEEEYVKRLGDATEFVVNLTDIPDDEFFELKKCMDSNTDVA